MVRVRIINVAIIVAPKINLKILSPSINGLVFIDK